MVTSPHTNSLLLPPLSLSLTRPHAREHHPSDLTLLRYECHLGMPWLRYDLRATRDVRDLGAMAVTGSSSPHKGRGATSECARQDGRLEDAARAPPHQPGQGSHEEMQAGARWRASGTCTSGAHRRRQQHLTLMLITKCKYSFRCPCKEVQVPPSCSTLDNALD